MNRRGFVTATLGGLVGLLVHRTRTPAEQYPSYRFGYAHANLLRPPGALPETAFRERCINCDLCGQACPIGVIQFFPDNSDGQAVPHTPYIVAAEHACDLCLKCTTVCPTGALRPVTDKREVNMGLAVLEDNLCLPFLRQGICGACYTVCPVSAVKLHMQRYPSVLEDRCVGCGLCEEVCLQEVKAIRVFRTDAAA